MVNGFARSLLVLSAALMASTSGAFAQDSARDLFDQGVQLLYQNKDAEALQKFKGAVSLDPSMADAYSIWKKTEQRVWASMMVKNDELAKVARHFLRMAQLERKRFQADAFFFVFVGSFVFPSRVEELLDPKVKAQGSAGASRRKESGEGSPLQSSNTSCQSSAT